MTATITVRLSTGTYVARAKGKSASCAVGPYHAAKLLAEKHQLAGQLELTSSSGTTYIYTVLEHAAQ